MTFLSEELLDWIELRHDRCNPAQMAALLVAIGSKLAFDCAPNIEEAKEVIQDSIQAALKETTKERKNDQS